MDKNAVLRAGQLGVVTHMVGQDQMVNPARLGGEEPVLPETVWRLTAPPLIDLPALSSGRYEADVAIVGSGFAGSMAALTLSRAGKKVICLDATEPGWGASGRNNGQVIAGFKWDPDEIVARYGTEVGERLVSFGGAAPDLVFDTIDEHDIQCDPVRNGWIQPAYGSVGAQRMHERYGMWASRGAPVELIPTERREAVLGTPYFQAAWLDRRGGSINPLAYARGLAKAAVAQGASIHANTPARQMKRNGNRWVIECANGAIVIAPKVIVTTGGYADDLVPGLSKSFVPVRTAQIASAPLPESWLRTILPGRQPASDTRRLITSFRISPDNRLVMGGSGAMAGLRHEYIAARLRKSAARMFGHLGTVDWKFAWSGYFAVTEDYLPHLHESADGLLCALGCNGRGIAMSSALGKLLAGHLLGTESRDMPIQVTPMKAVQFHAFRHVGVAVATQFKGLQDQFDNLRSS